MSTISWSQIQELSLDAKYMDIPCLTARLNNAYNFLKEYLQKVKTKIPSQAP